MRARQERVAMCLMLLVSISYGLAGFTARELQKEMGLWQQVAIQNWFACALTLLIVRVKSGSFRPVPISTRGKWKLLGRAFIGRVLGSVLFIQACTHATLGNVGWLSAIPASVFFAWLVWGERVSLREILLLAVSVVGVGFIMAPSLDSITKFGFGELCAIASALVIGFASLLGRDSVREADALSATVWVLFFTSACATAGALTLEGGLALPSFASLPVFVAVVCMVVIGSCGTLYGYTYLPASFATALLTLEALWSIVVGYVVYGEQPTALSWLGGGLIAWSALAIQPRTSIHSGNRSSRSLHNQLLTECSASCSKSRS